MLCVVLRVDRCVVVIAVRGAPASRDELAGKSFIPHFGQWSAVSLTISGCIGQA